jgi:hypothetical protein
MTVSPNGNEVLFVLRRTKQAPMLYFALKPDQVLAHAHRDATCHGRWRERTFRVRSVDLQKVQSCC